MDIFVPTGNIQNLLDWTGSVTVDFVTVKLMASASVRLCVCVYVCVCVCVVLCECLV